MINNWKCFSTYINANNQRSYQTDCKGTNNERKMKYVLVFNTELPLLHIDNIMILNIVPNISHYYQPSLVQQSNRLSKLLGN